MLEYARHLGASQELVAWLEKKVPKDTDTDIYEHVIDYLVSEDAPKSYGRMTWKQALSATESWDKTQQKRGNHIVEKPEDTEVVLDFGDGMKFVRLVGKAAYDREGYLMRHCVASYYGRDAKIYSLRDSKNNPHCTVEEDQQIKGKGNGDIHPKYIDYVVRFLEHLGMDVRDSEMEHLGYDVVEFGAYVTKPIFRDRYAPKDTKVEYRDDVQIVETMPDKSDKILLYRGDLVIIGNVNYDKLAEVSGSVYVQQGATFTAPKLAKSGYVDVREGATFTAPKLAKSGSVYVREGATFTAPKLAKSGSVYVQQGATFTAPKLGH